MVRQGGYLLPLANGWAPKLANIELTILRYLRGIDNDFPIYMVEIEVTHKIEILPSRLRQLSIVECNEARCQVWGQYFAVVHNLNSNGINIKNLL